MHLHMQIPMHIAYILTFYTYWILLGSPQLPLLLLKYYSKVLWTPSPSRLWALMFWFPRDKILKHRFTPTPISLWTFLKTAKKRGFSWVGKKQFLANYPTCSSLSESLKTSLLAASVSDLHFASFSKAESRRVRLQKGFVRQISCISEQNRFGTDHHYALKDEWDAARFLKCVRPVLKHFSQSYLHQVFTGFVS